MPNILFRDAVLTMHNKMTTLSTEKQYFLFIFVKVLCLMSIKLSLMPCNTPVLFFFQVCLWWQTRVILCIFPFTSASLARMLPFCPKNKESKNSSADGVFAWLVLLAVSFEAINNIFTKAADFSTCLRYPIINLTCKCFSSFKHLMFFMVKNLSLASVLTLHDISVFCRGTSESSQITQASRKWHMCVAHHESKWKCHLQHFHCLIQAFFVFHAKEKLFTVGEKDS